MCGPENVEFFHIPSVFNLWLLPISPQIVLFLHLVSTIEIDHDHQLRLDFIDLRLGPPTMGDCNGDQFIVRLPASYEIIICNPQSINCIHLSLYPSSPWPIDPGEGKWTPASTLWKQLRPAHLCWRAWKERNKSQSAYHANFSEASWRAQWNRQLSYNCWVASRSLPRERVENFGDPDPMRLSGLLSSW